jgi:integrase/recombinase XerC
VNELVKRYVRHLELERSISPFTVRNYTSDVQGFVDFLGANGVDSFDKVDRSMMRRYLAQLQEDGTSRASVSRKLSALRSFFRYLEREKLIEGNPISTLTAPKQDKRLPGFLTKDEVSRLVEAPGASTPQGLRDRAMLELLYASGLRLSEIANLDVGDIDLSSRQLRIWGKGAKERIGLMGVPAARALEAYLKLGRFKLQGKRETKALFLNRYGERIAERRVQHIMREYARRAGLDMRVFPHMMRHTFATHLLDGGADLRVVQDLLGHARLSSTQVYTHVSQNQIRRTYLAAHPRSGTGKGEG